MSNQLADKLNVLDTKLRELQKRASAVDAVISERRTRAGNLGKRISEARYRLELNPDVQSFMISLQQRVHQRGVGLYEKLLTALVQDVLPENPHPVCLELSTDKGLPALTIQLGRDDAKNNVTAQHIFDDTGGSLTNVVSSGLRFIALARSPLRKFLVLDEPDCWIEPFRIPRFADILSDMSNDVGVQAILISHHQDSAFAGLPDRMRLEKDAQGLIKVKKMRNPVWDSDSQAGIRSIRLERFMSHKDTILELGPGINVLSGPNHIGKSAIVNSLRVFAYNESADRQIMHGYSDFVITITLENGKVLTCKRVRKGSPKTTYTFFEPGMEKPITEPPAKNGDLPDFVYQHLNIQKLNDLDIQLSHQKMPVFLLNEPKTKQATLLSAGLEADYVRQMLKAYKDWNDTDRATIRNEEKELSELTASLQKWDETFSGNNVSLNGAELGEQIAVLHEKLLRLQHIDALVAKMTRAEKLSTININFVIPDAPSVRPVEQMFKLHKQWEHSLKISAIKIPDVKDIKEPKVRPLDSIVAFGKKWQQAENKYSRLSEVKMPEFSGTIPVLRDTASINRLATTWNENEEKLVTLDSSLTKTKAELIEIEAEIKDMCGDTCILCNQTLPHVHKG